MLISEYVEMKWNPRNKKQYVSLGYKFTNYGDTFKAKVEDLSKGSHAIVEVACDYCDKLLKIEYRSYLKQLENCVIKKNCCRKCQPIKNKESNLVNYSVENVMQVQEIKEKLQSTIKEKYGVSNVSQSSVIRNKIKENNVIKYGVEHYSQTEDFKNQVKETWNNKNKKEINEIIDKRKITLTENYGEDNPMKIKEFRKKAIETNLSRYGTKNVFASDYIKERIIQHNLENYGVPYFSQTSEFKNKSSETWSKKTEDEIAKIIKKREKTSLDRYGTEHPMQNKKIKKKALETLYENGTAPTSKQQLHIHSLVGGELNYPVGRSLLDIAYIDEKIYFEYDGGGHDLQVKIGNLSQEDFNKKEARRAYYLLDRGWKEMRLICPTDKLPKDGEIKDFVEYTKSFFNTKKGISVQWYYEEGYLIVNYKHKMSMEEYLNYKKDKEAI